MSSHLLAPPAPGAHNKRGLLSTSTDGSSENENNFVVNHTEEGEPYTEEYSENENSDGEFNDQAIENYTVSINGARGQNTVNTVTSGDITVSSYTESESEYDSDDDELPASRVALIRQKQQVRDQQIREAEQKAQRQAYAGENRLNLLGSPVQSASTLSSINQSQSQQRALPKVSTTQRFHNTRNMTHLMQSQNSNYHRGTRSHEMNQDESELPLGMPMENTRGQLKVKKLENKKPRGKCLPGKRACCWRVFNWCMCGLSIVLITLFIMGCAYPEETQKFTKNFSDGCVRCRKEGCCKKNKGENSEDSNADDTTDPNSNSKNPGFRSDGTTPLTANEERCCGGEFCCGKQCCCPDCWGSCNQKIDDTKECCCLERDYDFFENDCATKICCCISIATVSGCFIKQCCDCGWCECCGCEGTYFDEEGNVVPYEQSKNYKGEKPVGGPAGKVGGPDYNPYADNPYSKDVIDTNEDGIPEQQETTSSCDQDCCSSNSDACCRSCDNNQADGENQVDDDCCGGGDNSCGGDCCDKNNDVVDDDLNVDDDDFGGAPGPRTNSEDDEPSQTKPRSLRGKDKKKPKNEFADDLFGSDEDDSSNSPSPKTPKPAPKKKKDEKSTSKKSDEKKSERRSSKKADKKDKKVKKEKKKDKVSPKKEEKKPEPKIVEEESSAEDDLFADDSDDEVVDKKKETKDSKKEAKKPADKPSKSEDDAAAKKKKADDEAASEKKKDEEEAAKKKKAEEDKKKAEEEEEDDDGGLFD